MELATRSVVRAVGSGPSGLANIITVNVSTGNTLTQFLLHESSLRSASHFFDIALKDDWLEGHSRTVNLPAVSPQSFTVFAKFLLTGLVFLKPAGPALHEIVTVAWRRKMFGKMMNDSFRALYLADFLQAPDFSDALADFILENVAESRIQFPKDLGHFTPSYVNGIYAITTRDSGLRKMVAEVNFHSWSGQDITMGNLALNHDIEFVADWWAAKAEHFGLKDVYARAVDPASHVGSCRYHQHVTTGAVCYKMKSRYLGASAELTGM
ncbi:hypothetical protein NX059_010134 [Plenodomus lindquistii]|nr:hypothetical protein NX059_010134 [Plenodomus lindquistii]